MAVQALRIYESVADGSYVELIYDDVALTCNSGHVVCGSQAKTPLSVTLVIAGNSITQSFPPGSDEIVPLPVTLAVLTGQGKSGEGIAFSGFDSISFGHGG